jgi:hypothetical protein
MQFAVVCEAMLTVSNPVLRLVHAIYSGVQCCVATVTKQHRAVDRFANRVHIISAVCNAAGFSEMRGTASASSDVQSSSDSDSSSRVSFEVVRLMLEVSNQSSCLLYSSA